MGFLEGIVVVYLRELYYPDGFEFPLVMLANRVIVIEWVRELSTLLMILAVAIIGAKLNFERFALFLYTFGIWDITYYVALKIFLDWPETLLTWDILFLIPITWLGPVIAPLLCSLSMIVMALTILSARQRAKVHFSRLEWLVVISGALIIFIAFIQDFFLLLLRGGYFNHLVAQELDENLIHDITSFIPGKFNWFLFLLGFILVNLTTFLFIYRLKRVNNETSTI
jgi:hypothetical protein